MKLTQQDKLALMLTTAGSQRRLAALVGVSHQRIGRWLREGVPAVIDPETGYQISSAGAKKIPPEAQPLIDNAFSIHKQIVKDQAKIDGIPYSKKAPALIQRAYMRNGLKGDRVVITNTQFIRDAVRVIAIAELQESKQFINVSIRSTVNFIDYAKRAERRAKGKKRTKEQRAMRDDISQRAKIVGNDYTTTVFTKYETLAGYTDPETTAANLNLKLQEKHSPSATPEGFADMYLFQTPHNPARLQNGIKPTGRKANSKHNLTRK